MKKFSHHLTGDVIITPTSNGFIVSGRYCGTHQQWCFNSFEEAVNQLASMLGILEIGETITLDAKQRS